MKRPIFCFLFFFTVCSVGTFGYETQLANRLPGGVAVPLLWLIADNDGEADFTVNAHPATDTRTAGWVTQVSTLIQDIDRCTVIAVVQQQDGMVSGNPQVITYLSSIQPRLMDWGFQENKNQMLEFLQGYCPELIVFDRYLSPFECRRVESYLAIKYGITLQGSYYGADGRMLWDNETYADYHHRIVALGKDAAGNLFHSSSSSVESDTLNLSVSCSAMEETADGSYLLAGDNDGSLQTIVRNGSHWHVCGRQWTVRAIADTLCLSADRQVYGDNHVTLNFHPDFNSDFLKVDTRRIFLLVDDSRSQDAADCDQMRRMPCATRDQGKLTFDKITWNEEGSSRMMLAWYDGNLDDLKPTVGAAKQSGSDFDNESKRMGIAESMGKETLTIIADKSHVGEYKARLTTTSHCEATLVVFDSNGTKILEKPFGNGLDRSMPFTITHAGVYIVKAVTPDKEFTQKIIRK